MENYYEGVSRKAHELDMIGADVELTALKAENKMLREALYLTGDKINRHIKELLALEERQGNGDD